MDIFQIGRLFVDPFPNSKRRNILYQKLEELIQDLLRRRIWCDLWVNGSFLTEKEDPNDMDATLMIDPDFSDALNSEQRDYLMNLEEGAIGSADLDTFVFIRKRRDDPDYGDEFADPAATWHEVYGLEHSKRWLKGFAIVKLGETHVGLRICS